MISNAFSMYLLARYISCLKIACSLGPFLKPIIYLLLGCRRILFFNLGITCYPLLFPVPSILSGISVIIKCPKLISSKEYFLCYKAVWYMVVRLPQCILHYWVLDASSIVVENPDIPLREGVRGSGCTTDECGRAEATARWPVPGLVSPVLSTAYHTALIHACSNHGALLHTVIPRSFLNPTAKMSPLSSRRQNSLAYEVVKYPEQRRT